MHKIFQDFDEVEQLLAKVPRPCHAMPRPVALLVALLASVATAQMGFGKPPKNQRPSGPVKPNENFPWKDPFTPAAQEALKEPARCP